MASFWVPRGCPEADPDAINSDRQISDGVHWDYDLFHAMELK
jgi:hypothetical protein